MEAGRRVVAACGLFEREHELERLASAIASAMAGDGSVVAIEGEAGIGKSALLGYVVRRARDAGMRVLSARCGELEQGFGYGLTRQLFDGPLAAMAREERERMLGGAAALAAPALSLSAVTGGFDKGSVQHGLFWLSANLACEQPLLIVVDDAQWADPASSAFLSYLARRVAGLSVLVVYASRVGEGCSSRLPASVEPGLVACVLQPGALSERATLDLIEELVGGDGSEQFAHACRVATGGNPFLLQELLRALQADGIAADTRSCERVAVIAPDAIRRAILARLGRLGPAATELAFATAVLGKCAELRHAAALAGLDLAVAVTAVDVLTSAAILRAGRPLEFIHPIVRTTVYAAIPAARRAASHRQAAGLLERDGVSAAQLAAHLMAAEPAEDHAVVRCLRSAARAARDSGNPEAARDYIARALAEPPAPEDRATVTYELGSAELLAADPNAVEHLRSALESELDPSLQVAAALDLVAALAGSDRFEEAMSLLDAAIAGLRARGDMDGAMQLEGILAATAQLSPTTSVSVPARLARYAGRLSGATLGERLLLSAMAFDAARRPVSATYAADLAELALDDGRLLLEQHGHAPNFGLAALVLLLADRLERAERMFTLAVERARARGSLVGVAAATALHCQVLLRQGRVADAEAEGRSCLEAAGDAWILGRPVLIAAVLDAMLERADDCDCAGFLAQQGITDDVVDGSMGGRLMYSRGQLRLAAGDAVGALHDFEWRSGLDTPLLPTRASAALAHMQLGDMERAHAQAALELDRARVWGAPSALAFALRTAGLVAGGDDGIALLRESVAAVEHSPARYEHARSLTELGGALRRAGHRRDARSSLREGLDLADRCGAQRTARRAREELLATGARPRRAALSGADSLTPSERRVARLAADGLSNRDIAQTLFVTTRTVETHLGHIYDKLDVHSRRDLAGALDRPRTPGTVDRRTARRI